MLFFACRGGRFDEQGRVHDTQGCFAVVVFWAQYANHAIMLPVMKMSAAMCVCSPSWFNGSGHCPSRGQRAEVRAYLEARLGDSSEQAASSVPACSLEAEEEEGIIVKGKGSPSSALLSASMPRG